MEREVKHKNRAPVPRRCSTAGSAEHTALLREKAEEKTRSHGQHTHDPQIVGVHLGKLSEPALHGLGRGDIGKSFKDQHQADQGYKCFHMQKTTKWNYVLQSSDKDIDNWR